MDRVILPDAEWRHRPGLDRLAEMLGAHKGEARFVGGAVRDTMMAAWTPVSEVTLTCGDTLESMRPMAL